MGVPGVVHPAHRGKGIGSELVRRLEHLATDAASQRHPGVPVGFRTSGGLADSAAQRLLED